MIEALRITQGTMVPLFDDLGVQSISEMVIGSGRLRFRVSTILSATNPICIIVGFDMVLR